MKANRRYRPEPSVEIDLDSFKRSAREGLHTFFTPARLLFWIIAWPFQPLIRAVRPPHSDAAPQRDTASF